MPTVACGCGKSYRIQEGLGGKVFRCKTCNGKLVVPPDGTPDAAPKALRPAEGLRPSEVDKSLVGEQGTVAGNPGLLKFSVAQYFRCNPRMLWAGPVAGAVAGVLLWCQTKSPVIAAVAVPFMAVVTPLGVAEKDKAKFRSGNLCAALVIGTDPYTVAVLTDLSNDRSGPKLAVRIVRQPLAAMFGGAPRRGARLVAVSYYFGQLSKGHWDDFMPTVINCACTDPKQISRATAAIDPADWQLLERVVPRLPSRERGLYKLWEMPEGLVGGGQPV